MVVSARLGVAFVWLSGWSRRRGRRTFVAGGVLLPSVIALSYAAGASPIAEGRLVELVCLTGLAYGIWFDPTETSHPAPADVSTG